MHRRRSLATLSLSLPAAAALAAATPVFAAPPTGAEALKARIAALVGRPGGLTADDVAQRTVASSFDLRARAEQVSAAMAQVDAAFANYFPKLTLLGRFTRLSPMSMPSFTSLLPPNPLFSAFNFAFPVYLNSWTFQAQLAIPITDYIFRINQAHRSASTNVRATRTSEDATRLQIASDARVAYYTWTRARLQVVVAEQSVEQAKGHLGDAKRLFEVGNISKADVLRVESQVANAELLSTRARELERVLREQLRIAMHAPGAEFAIGEDVSADLLPLPHAHDLGQLQREATDRRLEVKAVEESLKAVRDQSTIAAAGLYPRLDAVLEGTYQDPHQRVAPSVDEFRGSFSATVQLSWSPNDLLQARAQVKSVDAKVRELQAQREQLRDGLRTEVAQAMRAVREATAAIVTTAQGLTAAEEAYRVRRELFRHGRSTVVELTDAETDLTRARLEAVGARIDLRIARARLLHASGRDLADLSPTAGNTAR